MALSKKHYVKVAAIIQDELNAVETSEAAEAVVGIATDLAVMFKEDNPRFDSVRFLQAAGVKL